MSAGSWILITEDTRLAGLVQATRGTGEEVTAIVVGTRDLAEAAAAAGPDAVRWFPTEDGVPAEALAPAVAAAAGAATPRVVLASTAPASRVLLAAAAVQLGAAVATAVQEVRLDGDTALITRSGVDGQVIETYTAAGPVACLMEVADTQPVGPPAPIDEIAADEIAAASDPGLRMIATQHAGSQQAGLLHAERVIGVGRGLHSRADLALIEELATVLDAQIACSLPLAEDLRWFDESRVVGTSTNRISPSLYLAVGISGQPQHLAGVRGTKVIAAINNNPDAPVFAACDYGVCGDLYTVVPLLTAALKDLKGI